MYSRNLRTLRSLLWQCSPKIHGRNAELSVLAIPTWLGVVLTAHNPTTQALRRDGPETRRCFQEVSIWGELLCSPKKERIVQPNKNHSIDVLGFGDSLVRVPYKVVLKQQSSA